MNSSKHMRSAALTVGFVFCKALMKSCKVSLGSSNLSLGTCIHVILIASGSRGLQGVKRSSTVMLGSIGEGPLCVLEVGCHSYFTYRHHEGFLHHSANIGSRVAFCPLSQSAEALCRWLCSLDRSLTCAFLHSHQEERCRASSQIFS